jgi:capsular polysaccharide biosynthesis protein
VLFTAHDPGSGQDQAYLGSYLQSRMTTYGKLVSSTKLLAAASAAIGSGETAETLRERTEIEVSEHDTVAIVQVTDRSAKTAARAANAVAAALIADVARLEPKLTTAPPSGDRAAISGTVTHQAVIPSSPIAPNALLYLLAGALAGLVVSVGVIVYREAWKRDGHTSSDAEGR